jgi:hypothetical protein
VNKLRGLVLVGLVVGLFAALGLTPANAAFSTAAPLTPMSVGTVTVTAPGSVTGSVACGRTTSTLGVSWSASTTPKVSGYVITAYFSDGYVQTMPTQAATATSWSGSVDTYYVTATTVHLTVTTQTSFGWTKESPATAELRC